MSDPSPEPGRMGLWGLALLFLVALGLRVGVVLQYEARHPFADRPVIDEASYDEWAVRIADGEWLGQEVFFQEPLYPYSLAVVYALVGHERVVVRLLQALGGALVALALARLTARMFGPRAGLLAGWCWALHRPAVLLPSLLLKPNLFLPILALLLLLLQRTRTRPGPLGWLGLGLLGGAAALCAAMP